MSPPELRASLILQVRAGQITAQEAARQLGISRQAYYKWERRALRALLQSLADQPRGRPPSETDPEKEQLQNRVQALEKQVRLHEERDQIRILLKQMEESGPSGSSTKKKRNDSAHP
jgi:transposase-like protein